MGFQEPRVSVPSRDILPTPASRNLAGRALEITNVLTTHTYDHRR